MRRGGRNPPALALGALVVLALACAAPRAAAKTVEHFFTVSTVSLDPTCSGTQRETVVVNGQWPGPTIYAEDGDTIIIHISNRQPLNLSIHVHGLAQRDAQWYDGVPGVTQCPIKNGKNFTVVLPVKGQWGTFWYHAHTNQMRNTVHGAVIISPSRDSNPEPLPVPIYNDLLLLGGDWYTETSQQLDDTILKPPYPGFPLPTGLHINGGTLCSGSKFFVVRMRKWYRIRIINTALWASFNFRVENHTFILHEAEGGYLLHKQVSSLDVYPGQSYSVLLYTNQKPSNYWMVINARYDVAAKIKLPGTAVLSYEAAGIGATEPTSQFPASPTTAEFGVQQQASLRSPYYNQELGTAGVQKLIVLEINANTFLSKDGRQVFSLNNVSFAFNSSTPFLLADYKKISDRVYSSTIVPDVPPPGFHAYKGEAVKISPFVKTVPYGAWVQLVLVNHNPPNGLHPFHLHGQNFYVVAQGNGTFNPRRWRRYKYNLQNPVLRNTVALFDSYWVAIRFKATNPGQWILHCHLEQHADQGLLGIIKVLWPASDGTRNGPQPLGAPPKDYPPC